MTLELCQLHRSCREIICVCYQLFAIQKFKRAVLYRYGGTQWKLSVVCTQLSVLCCHCSTGTLLLHVV